MLKNKHGQTPLYIRTIYDIYDIKQTHINQSKLAVCAVFRLFFSQHVSVYFRRLDDATSFNIVTRSFGLMLVFYYFFWSVF